MSKEICLTPSISKFRVEKKLVSQIARHFVPNIGTCFVVAALMFGGNAYARNWLAPEAPTLSTNTIPYQGRIANSAGTPLTGNYEITFALYSQLSGGAALWTEAWTGGNSVRISDGLFNVLLGSLQPIPQSVITGNSNLWLGVKVSSDAEMSPRVQLGSVPFATQALTVPDGSITKAKLASDVTDSLTTSPSGQVCLTQFAYFNSPINVSSTKSCANLSRRAREQNRVTLQHLATQ